MSGLGVVSFDGPCPFLSCLRKDPHEHEICPDCNAVRHGNASCSTCRAYHGYPELASHSDVDITEKPA